MDLTVLTKTGFFVDLEDVSKIDAVAEGYYFLNADSTTMLFVPADNLDHYVQTNKTSAQCNGNTVT